jgi:Holliday junction resolvase RusA-like endonuclease
MATQELFIPRWHPEASTKMRGQHWSVFHQALARDQYMAFMSAKAASWHFQAGPVHLTVRFVFSTQRRRDIDNLTTRLKGVIDGLKGTYFEDDNAQVLTLTVDCVVSKELPGLWLKLEPRTRNSPEAKGVLDFRAARANEETRV